MISVIQSGQMIACQSLAGSSEDDEAASVGSRKLQRCEVESSVVRVYLLLPIVSYSGPQTGGARHRLGSNLD